MPVRRSRHQPPAMSTRAGRVKIVGSLGGTIAGRLRPDDPRQDGSWMSVGSGLNGVLRSLRARKARSKGHCVAWWPPGSSLPGRACRGVRARIHRLHSARPEPFSGLDDGLLVSARDVCTGVVQRWGVRIGPANPPYVGLGLPTVLELSARLPKETESDRTNAGAGSRGLQWVTGRPQSTGCRTPL